MIKLIAFDWNGTLLSDTAAVIKADNLSFKKMGLKRRITLQEFQKYFQIPLLNYWKSLGMEKQFFKKQVFEFEPMFHNFYEPLADKCRTRSGSKQVLGWIDKNNIKSIIYSNHIKLKINKQLKRLKIENFISTVIAREQVEDSILHSRSKEQKLRDYIKLKKLKPKEVISVGDTEEEIEIGKSNGYYTVAITGGYNTAARLKKHKPDFLIHNMKELIGVVKKLNK